MIIQAATYNIAGGAGYSGFPVVTDYRKIAEDILACGADIVGLQEVDHLTRRNNMQDTGAEIAKYTGFHVYFAAATEMDGGTYGNLLVTKFPILHAQTIPVPFTRENEEHRCVLHAKLDIGESTPLDVFVTHSDQGSIRAQLGRIHELTAACERFLLLGDFNYADKKEDSAFGVFENCTLANPITKPLVTTFDGYSFDNIIVSDTVALCYPTLINTGNSDHLMLKATLTL